MTTQMQTPSSSQLPTLRSYASHRKVSPISDNESDDTNLNFDSVIFSALCMFDFTSTEAGVLSFKKNEILDIIKCIDGGWWAEEMSERLQDIRQELRGAEFKRIKELDHATWHMPYPPVFGGAEKPSLIPAAEESKLPSTQLYPGEGQNLSNSPPPLSRLRLLPTASTHHRLTSTQISSASPSPHQQESYDNQIRAGSLSIRSPRRRPVIVDDKAILSTFIGAAANSKQIDSHSLLTSGRQTSFGLVSKGVSKQVQEDKLHRKFTEAGGASFGSISASVHRQIQMDKVQRKAVEPGGPVINIGRPKPEVTPWYLRPRHADQLDIDSKGNVRSGPLISLFEMLTTNPGTSDTTKLTQFKTFTNVFLMTFRTFMTAHHLFDMLVKRFHLKPDKSLTEYEYMDWKANLLNPVQRLVLEIFALWLKDYRLLEEEPHIMQGLKDFLILIVSPPYNTTATLIVHTIDRLTSTNPIHVVSPSSNPKKSRRFRLDLSKIDHKTVAEQLVVYEFGLYAKITPQQCLTYVKTRTGNDVAELRDFCSTHDKLGAWVKMSILENDLLGKRAHTIDFWIKIAERCRTLNNISSMSAIITALSSTAITELHLTWAHTSRKPTLSGLLRYSEPTGGFAGYRSLLQQAEGPCVPFITMFLTEMAHVQDQFSETEGKICFYRRTRWYEIITAMLRFQSRPYNIVPDKSTINFIEGHLREGSCCDPGWFWKRSQEIQKEELMHADIRKGLEAAGF